MILLKNIQINSSLKTIAEFITLVSLIISGPSKKILKILEDF